jgi:NAD(P)-dependent dehydrogenase (short-subunit alcohol dehydrogenase family)
MTSTFKGKLVVITGAAKENGIGFATAYALAEQGADVRVFTLWTCHTLTGRLDHDPLQHQQSPC